MEPARISAGAKAKAADRMTPNGLPVRRCDFRHSPITDSRRVRSHPRKRGTCIRYNLRVSLLAAFRSALDAINAI